MAVCQNLVPLVNIKIAGKWIFIPLKMVLIGIDPYPYGDMLHGQTNIWGFAFLHGGARQRTAWTVWDLGDPGMMDRSPGSSSNNNVSKQHSPVVFIIRAVTCQGVWKRNSERETHQERDGKSPIKSRNRVFHGKFFYKWLNYVKFILVSEKWTLWLPLAGYVRQGNPLDWAQIHTIISWWGWLSQLPKLCCQPNFPNMSASVICLHRAATKCRLAKIVLRSE